MIALLGLQTALPAADALGDALVPIGGVAGAIALVRIALNAHDKRATTAEEREKACTVQLAAQIVAQAALTAELKENNADEKRRWEPIQRGMAELLEHARRGNR